MNMRVEIKEHTVRRWWTLAFTVVLLAASARNLEARQGSIPLNLGSQDQIPDSLRPEWRDTQGRPAKSIQIDPYTMDQQIEIDRVVSYKVDEVGKLKPEAEFNGVVSREAKITVLACVTTDNPQSEGVPIQIMFQKFNSLPILNTLPCHLVSSRSYKKGVGFYATHWFVSTALLKFARAGFDPMTVMINNHNYKLPASSPGINDLFFQAVVDARYQTQQIGHIVIHLFSYIDFDAIAPIILVHGTAAQADSWRQPSDGLTTIDGSSAYIRPFVSGNNGVDGYFDAASTQSELNPVLWFAGINLGSIYKLDGITLDKNRSGNQSFNNAAAELSKELLAISKSLGSNKMHIIAHSKGGSDVRQLIVNHDTYDFPLIPANNENRGISLDKYKILSLYTLGTPHQGTPSANISENVNINYMPLSFSTDGGLNSDIAKDAAVAAALQLLGVGPQGDALLDQMVGSPGLSSLNTTDSLNAINVDTDRHFYNMVGDADLNADGEVDFEEGKTLLPDSGQGIMGQVLNYASGVCDSMYQLSGKVGTVDVHKSTWLGNGFIVLIPHPYDASRASLIWPNDLVTPVWSGYLPGVAKPLILPADQSLSFKPRPGNFGAFTGVLSGGNHALIHRYDSMDLILKQIQIDYPIQEPE